MTRYHLLILAATVLLAVEAWDTLLNGDTAEHRACLAMCEHSKDQQGCIDQVCNPMLTEGE